MIMIRKVWRQTGIWITGVLCGMVFVAGSHSLFSRNPNNAVNRVGGSKIKNIHELLALSPEEIDRVDIALMNLICAEGLKGTENIDIEKFLSTIDEWATLIREDTQLRLPIFRRNPAKYDNSEKLFKVVNMVLYLKDKLGVNYDPVAMGNSDFSDPDKIFIHGLLTGKRSGTCTSMPVLCVAIGRRLAYPLKLVLAKGHTFFRWEDADDRLNIEACCPGVDLRDDEYYKKWPDVMDEADFQRGHYLRSLTATEELSIFLGARALTLRDNGRLYESQVAYANACLLMPGYVPQLLDLLSLIDFQLNRIAQAESDIAGGPIEYAVPTTFEGKQRYFIWRARLKDPNDNAVSNRPDIDVDTLVRRTEKANAERQKNLYRPEPKSIPIPK